MNILDLMDSKASAFSKNDRRIYESIKRYPSAYAEVSISEISQKSGFTKPALTRFAQKLGFSGFSEFQYCFSQNLKEAKETSKKSNADYVGMLLKQTETILENYPLDQLAHRMANARTIVLCGCSFLRNAAEILATSISINTDLIVITPIIDNLPKKYKKDDLILIYSSISGSAFQEFLRELKQDENHPYLVLVTPNAKHPLRHNFDEFVVLPTARLSPTSSAIADIHEFLFFNEMLCEKIIENC